MGRTSVAKRRDREPAAGRCKLGGVANQVPDDLHDAGVIGPHVVVRSFQLGQDVQARNENFIAADLHRAADHFVDIDNLELEPQPPAYNPRQVEQVVDQPGFQLNVAADHLEGRQQCRVWL
jgi:hypothetical protein